MGGALDEFGVWDRELTAGEVVTVVPEPSAYALVAAFAALGFVVLRRRHG